MDKFTKQKTRSQVRNEFSNNILVFNCCCLSDSGFKGGIQSHLLLQSLAAYLIFCFSLLGKPMKFVTCATSCCLSHIF